MFPRLLKTLRISSTTAVLSPKGGMVRSALGQFLGEFFAEAFEQLGMHVVNFADGFKRVRGVVDVRRGCPRLRHFSPSVVIGNQPDFEGFFQHAVRSRDEISVSAFPQQILQDFPRKLERVFEALNQAFLFQFGKLLRGPRRLRDLQDAGAGSGKTVVALNPADVFLSHGVCPIYFGENFPPFRKVLRGQKSAPAGTPLLFQKIFLEPHFKKESA